MKVIDKEKYRNIEIFTKYNSDSKLFHATSKIADSHKDYSEKLDNFDHGFKTPREAVLDVQRQIDNFYATNPITYEELAQEITSTLIWTGYEECHADAEIVEQLVKSFMKVKAVE